MFQRIIYKIYFIYRCTLASVIILCQSWHDNNNKNSKGEVTPRKSWFQNWILVIGWNLRSSFSAEQTIGIFKLFLTRQCCQYSPHEIWQGNVVSMSIRLTWEQCCLYDYSPHIKYDRAILPIWLFTSHEGNIVYIHSIWNMTGQWCCLYDYSPHMTYARAMLSIWSFISYEIRQSNVVDMTIQFVWNITEQYCLCYYSAHIKYAKRLLLTGFKILFSATEPLFIVFIDDYRI